jgi:hypothetical protein
MPMASSAAGDVAPDHPLDRHLVWAHLWWGVGKLDSAALQDARGHAFRVHADEDGCIWLWGSGPDAAWETADDEIGFFTETLEELGRMMRVVGAKEYWQAVDDLVRTPEGRQ